MKHGGRGRSNAPAALSAHIMTGPKTGKTVTLILILAAAAAALAAGYFFYLAPYLDPNRPQEIAAVVAARPDDGQSRPSLTGRLSPEDLDQIEPRPEAGPPEANSPKASAPATDSPEADPSSSSSGPPPAAASPESVPVPEPAAEVTPAEEEALELALLNLTNKERLDTLQEAEVSQPAPSPPPAEDKPEDRSEAEAAPADASIAKPEPEPEQQSPADPPPPTPAPQPQRAPAVEGSPPDKVNASSIWVINALSTQDPAKVQDLLTKLQATNHTIYTYEKEVDGQNWHRVRVGFFRTKAEAEQVGRQLAARYHLPEPWLVKPGPQEINKFKTP